MNKLVNSVECAKILSLELNRSIQREFISRLATENRIPYQEFEGKKLYNPSEVMKNLPPERVTSYNDSKRDYIYQLDVIEYFQAQGLNIKFDRKHKTKKSYKSDDTFNIYLPTIIAPSIEDVRVKLNEHKPTKEALNIITDEMIQKEIESQTIEYGTLNTLWCVYVTRSINKDYIDNLKVEVDELTDNQLLMVFYSILDMFVKANVVADIVLDEVYNKID
jgi:hypothetical protein